MTETQAEIRLPTQELRRDLPFFTRTLGMRLDMIYPSDDPRVAVFSGHGLRIRVETGAPESPGTIRIRTDDPEGFAGGERELTAPNGTRVEIDELNPPLVLPQTIHSFVVRRLADQAPWIVGRAGMEYRDLIPDRLGGSIIASHIRIPDGGPVPDMVHYHTVGFQLIFCIAGWVDVLYEDQGPPIRLRAGNCFIQPPEIRHRVLCASESVEVIEIGVPAEHVTTIDHQMELPTPHYRPDREWSGQKFVHHEADRATWAPHRLPGYVSRDTTISDNTGGYAGVHVVRRGTGEPEWRCHDADILFTYVMNGGMTLEGDGREPYRLETGDAFVIPPHMRTCYSYPTDDIELLEVTLPGRFETTAKDIHTSPPRPEVRLGRVRSSERNGVSGNAEHIRQIVLSIPKGKVVTYGDIAYEVFGTKVKALPVAAAISAATKKAEANREDNFPWWRVVNRDLKPPAIKPEARRHLEGEGVEFAYGSVKKRFHYNIPPVDNR